MSQFAYRVIPVLLVFMVEATFAWIWGGARASKLTGVIPWVWAFLLEGMLCFPQHAKNEDGNMARLRTWRRLRRDPALYFMLVLLAVLIFPLFNVGLCPSCDAAAIAGGMLAAPPVSFVPFCVNPGEHATVLTWFVPIMTGVLAVRHALQKDGRRMLFELLVWNAFAMAVFGFIQQGTGAEAPYWSEAKVKGVHFFSTFGYPNMGGAFFTMSFAFAIGLWRQRVREVAALPPIRERNHNGPRREQMARRFVMANYPVVAVVGCFFGSLATLSRAAIIMTAALAALAFVMILAEKITARKNRAERFKEAVAFVGFAAAFAVAVNIFAPEELTREIDSVSSSEVLNRVSGKAQYHTRVAIAIFRAHPFYGVGGWGYKHFCSSFMTKDELKHMQMIGGVNVHNDYCQFLCEHGLVGVLALLGVLVCLAVPFAAGWHRTCRVGNFTKNREAPPRPVAFFAPPPPMPWTVLGCACLMVHACGDCPMRSPAVLMMFFLALGCAGGYLPDDPSADDDGE